ncbi:hypothetical protein RPMA_04815 [Tardiphaga alba]|uniref:Outer membrane beta-barrel porin/alpha-amylase n=2 Tax=Tardiphaga alba TaxID=340268 RepID=A0ABX8AFD7_9BRAD|nr:hypothetical protein RPMA_04815 [Tardiphaga alba]
MVTAIRGVIVATAMLVPSCAFAGYIDTEHIFAFMIGSDIGQVGEREFQSETTGRSGKSGGRYRVGEQEFELELVPARDIRIELGSSISAYDLAGIPGVADRRGFAWQGASVDIRYRLLDREAAPVGMTLAFGGDVSRLDEGRAQRVNGLGAGLRLAFDREVAPGFIGAVNFLYQPEWTRFADTGRMERESVLGVSLGMMVQVRAGVLLGGEARYLRRYEGVGLNELAGQTLFVGPTAYVQLSPRTRLTASWSTQAWGRPDGGGSALDLVNFERHQARLVYGVNF